MRLLLVEDNRRLANLILEGLSRGGYVVDHVTTLAEAAHAIHVFQHQLIVLDLGLPDGDGLDLLRALREQGRGCPTLILTAREALSDRLVGLDAGADDYLVKPFSMDELLARINALLRRPFEWIGNEIIKANTCLDLNNRLLRIDAKTIDLPANEYRAIECLFRSRGISSKERLLDTIYGMDAEVSPNALEVLIHRLRKRLQAAGARISIEARRGFGYEIREL